MEQLDNTKIPRIASTGEKYRDAQLILQLPRQDLAPEHCRNLKTPAQRKSFEDFRNLRDSTAMDVGYAKDYVKEDTVSGTVSRTV